MRKFKITSWIIGLAVMAAVFVVLPGCEEDADMGDLDRFFADNPFIQDPRTSPASSGGVTISPKSATATSIGEQFIFRVTGGSGPYSWTTANANGTMTAAGGDGLQGTYTVAALGVNNVIVSDKNGFSAIADIVRFTSTLGVTPTVANPIITGGTAVTRDFFASGGVTPYAWGNGDPGLGAMAGLGANSQTGRYTTIVLPGAAYTNSDIIVLTDAEGNNVQATLSIAIP